MERRALFLQTVAESLGTHLADNIDYLFHPWGMELPDPTTVGHRLNEQLAVLDACDVLWRQLGDDASRDLLMRFLAYRALGPAHVRLQLDPGEYRRNVIALGAQALQQAAVLPMHGMPMEWRLHLYDFSAAGLPLQLVGAPLPLASTLVFSQYAYRDATVVAGRPRPGEVVVDVGGCWGDTALWFAHMVGEEGFVHTFEPTPSNRRLLEHNLSLNPHLSPQVALWADPIGPVAGDSIYLPDVLGAGATSQADDDPSRSMVELSTETIDNMVAAGHIDRVDFLKVDVEGADLGVLKGAAETIRAQRPRLALAIYHRPDDLVQLPDFIDSLGVDYRWYLQASTMTDIDTVAFGVPTDP